MFVEGKKSLMTQTYVYFISVPFDTRLSPICKWKHVYLRMYHLTRNWEKGRFYVSPTLRGHSQRVTAIDSNGKEF